MKTQLTIVMVLLVAAGCRTPSFLDHRDLFRHKHPTLAEQYTVLAPASLYYMEYEAKQQHAVLTGAVSGMTKRLTGLKGDTTAARTYLTQLQKMGDTLFANPDWRDLRGRLRRGDSVYFFHFKKPGYSDHGYLVIRDGDIVFRCVVAALIEDNKATPPDIEINKLEQEH